MARYQQRHVLLKKGRKTLHIAIEHGHVYEYEKMNQGMRAHTLYNETEELAMLEKLVRRAKKNGFVVVDDTGVVAKITPKKPSGMDATTWRWVQDADEMLRMWREDDYDNLKDAILDARSMIDRAPKDQRARVARLEKMLSKATTELQRLAKRDPDVAKYARGLIAPPRARRTASKSPS